MACYLLKDTIPAKEKRTRETVKSRIIGEIVRNYIIMLTQNMLCRKHLRKPFGKPYKVPTKTFYKIKTIERLLLVVTTWLDAHEVERKLKKNGRS